MAKVAEIYAKVTPKHPAKDMTAVLAEGRMNDRLLFLLSRSTVRH